MSMHAIESLVEYSVITVATALPVPPLAQSICHSLYHLQNQLDCGYTVLRVRDELEKVGYLSLLSPEQLPEPERSEAMELAAEGGFLKGGGIYVDRRSGKCCVTAGCVLWKKLLDMSVIPASPEAELRLLDPLELAEQIVSLASKALAGGDKRGADTLGHWYAFFPLFCAIEGWDDANAPEPERIQALLRLLDVPEAFEVAASYGNELDVDYEEEEMPFLVGWEQPYRKWLKERKNDEGIQEGELDSFHRNVMYQYIQRHNFEEADRYASLIADGFERLSGLPLPEQELATCRVYLLQTVVLLGDYPAVIEMQQALFTEAIGKLEQYPEGETRQMQQIALALSYYQMLYVNLPDEYPSKKELMRKRFPGLMELSDVKRICGELLPEKPQMADTLQENMEQCNALMQYLN